jgi:hypothetical protein
MGLNGIILAGYSFGAWVNAHMDWKAARISDMIMVAPPVDLLDFDDSVSIDCLSMVICGDKDEFGPAERVKTLARHFNPNVRVEVISGANHFFSYSLKTMEDFLRKELEECPKDRISRSPRPVLDPRQLFKAFDPGRPLDVTLVQDRKYYIDFAPVRAGNLIRELTRTIALSESPTCQLFTGHIGCGKSTELLRLKAELEKENYQVVYFVSSDDLDMCDLDITDILLVIARKVVEELEKVQIRLRPGFLNRVFEGMKELLQNLELEPGIEFSALLGKISLKAKDSKTVRNQLRDHLESRTDSLIDGINKEIFEAAGVALQTKGSKGLVVIVDNLDRVANTPKFGSRTQPEYLFIDRGDQLKRLRCHTLFTIPLSLTYSNDFATLSNRFGRPKVLAMTPIRNRNGQAHEQGMTLLRQAVLARALPDLADDERLKQIGALFTHKDLLEKTCRMSGGHIRNLFRIVYSCAQKDDPPFSSEILDQVIQEEKNEIVRRLEPDERKLLHKVIQNQSLAGEKEYDTLLRSMFVFEYDSPEGVWYGVNPVIEDVLG